MKVYELRRCGEYAWQESLGLYDSIETIRAAEPSDIIVFDNPEAKENHLCMILARSKCAFQVREALEANTDGYWWYDLPDHGENMFVGIFQREIRTS